MEKVLLHSREITRTRWRIREFEIVMKGNEKKKEREKERKKSPSSKEVAN